MDIYAYLYVKKKKKKKIKECNCTIDLKKFHLIKIILKHVLYFCPQTQQTRNKYVNQDRF